MQFATFSPAGAKMAAFGCVVAFIGLLVETAADHTKSLFKISLRRTGQADRPFTGGLYRYSRHANYLGEIVFWAGSLVAGLPSLIAPGAPLITRATRAVTMLLGLLGIVSIMLAATKRLEGKQKANAATIWPVIGPDGELDSYTKYVARSGALFPRF